MKNLLENKLWILDYTLITIFIYLTYFEKPHWCLRKELNMNNDCSEDSFGNKYFLLNIIPFSGWNDLITTFFIMVYFNFKFYLSYLCLKKGNLLLNSNREIKLVLTTVLNLFYLLLYFLEKDGIIQMDLCLIIKTLFLFLIV